MHLLCILLLSLNHCDAFRNHQCAAEKRSNASLHNSITAVLLGQMYFQMHSGSLLNQINIQLIFLMPLYWSESSTHCWFLSHIVWVYFTLPALCLHLTAYFAYFMRVNILIQNICLHEHKLSCFVLYFHCLPFPPGPIHNVQYSISFGFGGVGFLWLRSGWQVFCRLYVCDWWSKTSKTLMKMSYTTSNIIIVWVTVH